MHQICVLHYDVIWPSGYVSPWLPSVQPVITGHVSFCMSYCLSFIRFDLLSFSFICDNCLKKSGKTRKENKFSSKSKLCLRGKLAYELYMWSFLYLIIYKSHCLIVAINVFVKGCRLQGWGHTLRTEWTSTWKDRTTRRPARCLCEWWPALTNLWRLNLAWSLGKTYKRCCSALGPSMNLEY